MALFDSLRFGELEIRNRIMMSPMSQRAAGEDGCASDWHLVHYGSRAVGGCGLVMVEDTAVSPLGRTSHSALGLYEPKQAEALQRIVAFCHGQGATVGLQLAHAGRKALSNTRGASGSLSASPLAFGPGWVTPTEAGPAEIAQLLSAFAASTQLALDAGFDIVEIHAAHGYLLHQFLSPLTNNRHDAYGSDGSGRRRLLLEVVQTVRAQWPEGRPLFVRLPAGDGETAGLQIEEMVECARACEACGADLIDVTGGTPLLGGKRVSSADVIAFAKALVGTELAAEEPGLKLVDNQSTHASASDPSPGMPVALGGGIVDGLSAQELINLHGASLVSVGRPLLGEPYWPLRAARELGVQSPVSPIDALHSGGVQGELWLQFGGSVSSPDHRKQIDD